MPRVFRSDERLAAFKKPTLQPTSQFKLNAEDCLVVCAGFEDRAVAVLRNALIVSAGFSVILVNYLPFVPENRIDEIRGLCHERKLPIIPATYDRQNPGGFGSLLLEKIAGVKGRVFLDVSAMSRLLIVQSLVAFASRNVGFKDCFVAYTEADSYPPTRAEVAKALKQSGADPTFSILLLSSGVFDVTVIPELSSTTISSTQTRLVAFPTFSADQITALRAELQPSRFTLIQGIPPKHKNQWRTKAIAKINRMDSIIHEEYPTTCTLDYRQTLDCLLRLYSQHAERERLLISPTGSKMQAVAVGLFRAFVNDVQIVYPTPKEFRSPTNYTKGVGRMSLLSLDEFTTVFC